MKRIRGFTLVELVVFIVIIGVAAFALFRSFSSLLPRSPTAAQLTQATELAQERMELILAQRDIRGYTNLVDLDPCNVGAPAVCANASGFVVTSTGTSTVPGSWVQWNANPTTNYKLVSVTVKLGGVTFATQSAVLSNYLP